MTNQDIDRLVYLAADFVKAFLAILLSGIALGLFAISLRLLIDYSDSYIEALAKWMSGL
jgi:hypothetical protein